MTPLAHLGLVLVPPSPALRPYIAEYWYMRGADIRATPEFMHPGGGFGVVFDLGGGLALDGQPLTDAVFLDGANTISRQMSFAGNIEALGIRFHPSGAYPFLAIPLVELANSTAPLDALGMTSVRRLHEQIGAAATLAGKIAHLEAWLLARQRQEPSRLVVESLRVIRAHGGQIGMKALADDLHISQRQLERLYQIQVGMPPKQFARLQRVGAARQALKRLRADGGSVARISAALDYYDQAHFTREFKSVVGLTPLGYLNR